MLYINDMGSQLIGGSLRHAKCHTRVDHVQADGKELEYIYSRFEGIPKVFSPDPESGNHFPDVVQWWGEMAQFIAGNLT